MPPTLAFSLPGCEITAVSQSDHVLTITAHPTAPTDRCPRGGISSPRIHSFYTRRPRDLPLWEFAVRLVLHVRRFRCLNASCTAHTFAERLPQVVRPAAQRTMRLTTALQQLGLALGGAAGARLGATLYMPASPDTLLRLIRQLPDPITSTPAVLGVDDWAMRRGHTYGTLLVDLERHRPFDLLPERTADTLATWLLAHPRVIILSRDRSTEYARGATLGAPEAQHVLDRWHLVRHLRKPSNGCWIGCIVGWRRCHQRARWLPHRSCRSTCARFAARRLTRFPARHGGRAESRATRRSAPSTPRASPGDTWPRNSR